jgi:UDP-N-acetylmuramoyl-L-alanyl-D-glutamate--2,6-diaminopimelate ligase
MRIKKVVRALIPAPILSLYHLALAYLGAAFYRFPSKKLVVIGVTGTDGKSSTAEYINAIFESAGRTTALSNSIRIKIADRTEPSTGRSMPGRFFIQRFMRHALRAGCTHAIIEMTSEGVRQHRHRGIALDALVFTNLSPEHIESHGSLTAYANAKFEIGLALARSAKRPRTIVANQDDSESARYLALPVEATRGFSLTTAAPWHSDEHGGYFTFDGTRIDVRLPGEFSLKNALTGAEVARACGIGTDAIVSGIARVESIPGRLERIEAGQPFAVVVDYALTPEALEALYKTFAHKKKVCVFGTAGGGRDRWKRPVLGALAEKYCEAVIITNDIAYDEDPRAIAEDIARSMQKRPTIELDRRKAIRRAFEIAHSMSDAIVLITGMGIDTEITGRGGTTIPWSDAAVAREELDRYKEAKRV